MPEVSNQCSNVYLLDDRSSSLKLQFIAAPSSAQHVLIRIADHLFLEYLHTAYICRSLSTRGCSMAVVVSSTPAIEVSDG